MCALGECVLKALISGLHTWREGTTSTGCLVRTGAFYPGGVGEEGVISLDRLATFRSFQGCHEEVNCRPLAVWACYSGALWAWLISLLQVTLFPLLVSSWSPFL